MTAPQPGQPVVFSKATVLTMDDAHQVLNNADVLVSGETIAAVGPNLEVPEGSAEIDAAGGIVMPGLVDTHRHMWQTAMRGYGADWTLTQYFVYYYLQWGKIFRPEDVHAGNLLSAIEAVDAGVTTSVDWSHGLRTLDHAEAATDALEAVPGRFVLAYGNIYAGAWEWATTPEFRDFYTRRFDGKGDMLTFQIAFDLPGIEGFPEKAAFEAARDLGVNVTTHAGVWKGTGDALPRQLPQDRRDRRVRLGLHGERVQRRAGLLTDLAAAQVRHPRLALAGPQRVVERRHLQRDARHPERRPGQGARRGAREGRDRHQPHPARRGRRRLRHPRRREGPRARLGGRFHRTR